MAAVIGYLMPTGELTGSLESTGELVGEITKPSGGSPYTGDYEVMPREELIRLLTNGLTMTDDLIIDAIPEDYVGSAVPRQSALSVSGNAITAPAGFYAEDLTETVQTGVEGIPTAVKGAVSNNSIEITPKVRNNEGYIPGSTLEGIPVSVSAGDLVSGTKTITSNVNSSNVTNYRYVRVDVQPNLETKNVTPSETAQTVTASPGYDGMDQVNVSGIPGNYVGSNVPRRSGLTVSGLHAEAPAGFYESAVSADLVPDLQTKQHTPTETATTIQADVGHDGLSAVEVAGIPSDYVGSGVTRRSSLQVTGKTVKAQAGYYSDEVTATVSTATPGVPVAQMSAVSNHAVTITPKVTNPEGYMTAGTTTGTPVSVSAGDLVSGTRSFTANTTSADVTNYRYVDVAVPASTPALDVLNVTPSLSAQSIVAAMQGLDGFSQVNVSAVTSGSVGTPTVSTSTVSANRITITPMVTVSTGYVNGGTFTGTAITVSASDLVSGILNITSSGMINVKTFATASVPDAEYDFGSGQAGFYTEGGQRKYHHNSNLNCWSAGWLPTQDSYASDIVHTAIPTGTVISPLTTAQTIGGAKWVLEDAITFAAMPSGTAGTPSATKGAVSNNSVTVTPTVTNSAGYIQGGTKTGTGVNVSASELVSGTLSITANTSSADVTNYKYVDVSVSGGGGKNVQIATGTKRIASTAYTDVGYEITVAKTGTYTVHWAGWRSSTSGTNGAQLYVNGTASGSAVTTFDGTWTNVQNGARTSVSLTQGDKVTLRARSRGTSYYMYIFFLSIEEV